MLEAGSWRTLLEAVCHSHLAVTAERLLQDGAEVGYRATGLAHWGSHHGRGQGRLRAGGGGPQRSDAWVNGGPSTELLRYPGTCHLTPSLYGEGNGLV